MTPQPVFNRSCGVELSAHLRHPFNGWLFAMGAEETGPSLVAFVPLFDREGHVHALLGALSAKHPLCGAFALDPSALILTTSEARSPRLRSPGLTVYAEIWMDERLPDEWEAQSPIFALHARITRVQAMIERCRR